MSGRSLWPVAQAARDGDDEAQAWMDLADELNDADITYTVDDFDQSSVVSAKAAAERFDAPWPPRHGDFEAALGGGYGWEEGSY